jgi:hypothetical protein
MDQSNIKETKEGLVEVSSGRSIFSPLDMPSDPHRIIFQLGVSEAHGERNCESNFEWVFETPAGTKVSADIGKNGGTISFSI